MKRIRYEKRDEERSAITATRAGERERQTALTANAKHKQRERELHFYTSPPSGSVWKKRLLLLLLLLTSSDFLGKSVRRRETVTRARRRER